MLYVVCCMLHAACCILKPPRRTSGTTRSVSIRTDGLYCASVLLIHPARDLPPTLTLLTVLLSHPIPIPIPVPIPSHPWLWQEAEPRGARRPLEGDSGRAAPEVLICRVVARPDQVVAVACARPMGASQRRAERMNSAGHQRAPSGIARLQA
jgi:hypothetical protein